MLYLPGRVLHWFRALCDEDGPTPCCFKNTCVAKPKVECTCTECYDTRSKMHAEYAEWKPENDQYKLHNFSASLLCR